MTTKPEEATEKDKEAAKEHRIGLEKVDAIFGGMTNPQRRIYAEQYERSFLAGILHERAKGVERELLNRFANVFITEIYEAVSQRREANAVESIIDQFLASQAKGENGK